MSRIFSWLHAKSNLPTSEVQRRNYIESLIVRQQLKELSTCIREPNDRRLCIDAFFHLLPTLSDRKYLSDFCEFITKKSRLTSNQLSSIFVAKLSGLILDKNFLLFEMILRLPLRSVRISLPTYELTQFLHTCPDTDQITQCLSILIERNLPYDSDYLSWILIILCEHFMAGDEKIIEYLLQLDRKNLNLLTKFYGNNSVTPLMLFLHLYTNDNCHNLIDQYISNIIQESVLLQCDKWNRSYLMHLLCGQCQHEQCQNSSEIMSDDILQLKEELGSRCPHASSILSKFSMFHSIGNQCTDPIKTILTSQYCLPLRLILLNYLFENDFSMKDQFEKFFIFFPSSSIPIYSKYLKRLVHNQNLNSTLASVLTQQRDSNHNIEPTIRFLLRQGARIDDMSHFSVIIPNLVAYSSSMIPFMMLDYGLYIDIPFDPWLLRQPSRMHLYICRLIQCGYPSEFRTKFDTFKSHLTPQIVKSIEGFIDLKNPSKLSRLCLQKLRSSLVNLGDESKEKLKDYLPVELKQSITNLGYNECQSYFRTAVIYP